MYLEIFHDTVVEILSNEGNKKGKIIVQLTGLIAQALEKEVNESIKKLTDVPIEYIGIDSLTLFDREVFIETSTTLNPIFERKLLERFEKLSNNGKNSKTT